jgi:type III restriction enzyme
MPDDLIVNSAALEPLFAPWEEPIALRVRGDKAGDPAKVVKNRRPSPIPIVNNLRMADRKWREAFYVGASETTNRPLTQWTASPPTSVRPLNCLK